jgi:hypothetical protein
LHRLQILAGQLQRPRGNLLNICCNYREIEKR